MRDLALRAPDGLLALESAEGPSLFDSGAMIALLMFTLGWMIFCISMLRAGVYSRRGPILILAGFFAVPVLGAALPAGWSLIAGNIVLGRGWILLGRELFRANQPASAP